MCETWKLGKIGAIKQARSQHEAVPLAEEQLFSTACVSVWSSNIWHQSPSKVYGYKHTPTWKVCHVVDFKVPLSQRRGNIFDLWAKSSFSIWRSSGRWMKCSLVELWFNFLTKNVKGTTKISVSEARLYFALCRNDYWNVGKKMLDLLVI